MWDTIGDIMSCEEDLEWTVSAESRITLELYRLTHDVDADQSYIAWVYLWDTYGSEVRPPRAENRTDPLTTLTLINWLTDAERILARVGIEEPIVYSVQNDCRCCS
jgi:hypothetical protein